MSETLSQTKERMRAMMLERLSRPAWRYLNEHHRMTWQSGYWDGFEARMEWDQARDAETMERIKHIKFGGTP